MIAQRLSTAVKDRGWYHPGPVEINAVMTSLKKKRVIKYNSDSKIYPITTEKKQDNEFQTGFNDLDNMYGINGKSTLKHRDKIGKKIGRKHKELSLTANEIKKYITPKNLRAWSSTSKENESPFVDSPSSLRIVMYYVDKENKRLIRHNIGSTLGQNSFRIVNKESLEYKKAKDFILSKKEVGLYNKRRNTERFLHRCSGNMRKDSRFQEKFEDYIAKYCLSNKSRLSNLSEPILPSRITDSACTTTRPPNGNKEGAGVKVKKRKNRSADGKPKAKKQKKGRPRM